MDRTQLDARNTAVLGRWWVTMRDTGGRPPAELLDELALTAREYAYHSPLLDALRDEVTQLRASAAPGATPDAGVTESPTAGGAQPRTASSARPRRQPAGRGKVTP